MVGHTIEEQAQAERGNSSSWRTKRTAIAKRTGNAFVATAIAATFDADPAERFGYGLRAFLDGVRGELGESPTSNPVASA